MPNYLSLGHSEAWQSLSTMRHGSLYWLVSDNNKDIEEASWQVIKGLPDNSLTAFIGCGTRPDKLLSGIDDAKVRSMPLFFLPDSKAALINLTRDIGRAHATHFSHFILHISKLDLWQQFTTLQLEGWLQATKKWLKKNHATLLIIQHERKPEIFIDRVGAFYYSIGGASRLYRRMGQQQWHIAWWHTPVTLLRNQTYDINTSQTNWIIETALKQTPLVEEQSDELLFLVSKPILQGAPPLNQNWKVFEDNAILVKNGKHYEAATIIFALNDIDRLEILARQIHLIRTSCGGRVKIIVRELVDTSRFSDIQLLLLCGANLVVPHDLAYSKFILIIESVRGQYYTRSVPHDIHYLLTAIRPIEEKGIVSSRIFVERVLNRMKNDFLLADEKGILLVFKPKSGLTPEQAIATCHIVRDGDIITVIDNQVYLFLSTCGVGDNQIVIQSLFNIPFNLLCETWEIYHQDSIVIKQLKGLRTNDELQARDILPSHARDEQRPKENVDFLVSPYSPTPINLLDYNDDERE